MGGGAVVAAIGPGDGKRYRLAGAGVETAAGQGLVEAKQAAKDEKDDPSIWDLLTRDKDLKPGNERLRRLKTQ